MNCSHSYELKPGKGSVHTKRTIMLKELSNLLDYVNNDHADLAAYRSAIIEENCLGKKTSSNRRYTAQYLQSLYILDTSEIVYKAFLFYWKRDAASRPMLALLLSYLREVWVRESFPYITTLSVGMIVDKNVIEDFIEKKYPLRFSPIMKSSLVRNLLSTWTQSGYLLGKTKKTRKRPAIGVGAVAFALYLGYIFGKRGEMLLQTDYTKLLETLESEILEHAQIASMKGWLVLKRAGNVVEILFPNFKQEKCE